MTTHRATRTAALAGACAICAAALPSRGAIFLNFGTSNPNTTSVTVNPAGSGGTTSFTFDVYVNETAAGNNANKTGDLVSSISYSVTAYKGASTISNAFQLNGRSQNATQSNNLTPASPTFTTRNLLPNYAGNLGGYAPTTADLAGIANRDTVTYSVQLLAAATVGTYTLQFSAPPGSTLSYGGASDPNTGAASDFSFAGTNTFTVNVVAVPEPAALAGVASIGLVALRRRRLGA